MRMREDEGRHTRRLHGYAGATQSPQTAGGFEPQTRSGDGQRGRRGPHTADRINESVSRLPRKVPHPSPFGARTENRHRLAGRVYQGVERTLVKELGNIVP